MAKNLKQGGSRRRDRELIRRLLEERRATGESYASVAARTGIPVGTLAWWAHRERQQGARVASPFVEIRVKEDPIAEPQEPTPTSAPFAVEVEPGARVRRISVPTGFDARELQRLVAALEASC